MQLSPLYLERIQEAQQVGEQLGEVRHAQAQTVRLLNRWVGDVSADQPLSPLYFLQETYRCLISCHMLLFTK
jgi:hypothetical protein